MNQKDKLLTLARHARNSRDWETLEQVKMLNETLNLLSENEEGLLHWGVYAKWIALAMNSNFFHHLRDYKKYNLGVTFSSAGQVLVREIVDPDKAKKFYDLGYDIIELQFVASNVIPEEYLRRDWDDKILDEISEIESNVKEAVSTFMSDIEQFAETYGWMKCRQTKIYVSSRREYGTNIVLETGISLKETLK